MIKFKPMKDVDSALRSRFLKIASWVFPSTGFLTFFVGYVKIGFAAGILIGIISGLLSSVIALVIVEHLGSSSVDLLYGRRKPRYSDYEKFEGALHQARNQKMKKEYHRALVLVNDILKNAPDLPEALYLKAQILWEGYQKAKDSTVILEQVLEILPDQEDTYHRWARTLMDDIKAADTPAVEKT
jgi:hypothetical protein